MPFTLAEVVPWGRSFDEYAAMFALDAHDLSRRILGCADGPASFNAEATARGARVVSCDPLYQFNPGQIASRIAEVSPVMRASAGECRRFSLGSFCLGRTARRRTTYGDAPLSQ